MHTHAHVTPHHTTSHHQFVEANEAALAELPPPLTAAAYYRNEDLYMVREGGVLLLLFCWGRVHGCMGAGGKGFYLLLCTFLFLFFTSFACVSMHRRLRGGMSLMRMLSTPLTRTCPPEALVVTAGEGGTEGGAAPHTRAAGPHTHTQHTHTTHTHTHTHS
jgi:hypothetical protein